MSEGGRGVMTPPPLSKVGGGGHSMVCPPLFSSALCYINMMDSWAELSGKKSRISWSTSQKKLPTPLLPTSLWWMAIIIVLTLVQLAPPHTTGAIPVTFIVTVFVAFSRVYKLWLCQCQYSSKQRSRHTPPCAHLLYPRRKKSMKKTLQ